MTLWVEPVRTVLQPTASIPYTRLHCLFSGTHLLSTLFFFSNVYLSSLYYLLQSVSLLSLLSDRLLPFTLEGDRWWIARTFDSSPLQQELHWPSCKLLSYDLFCPLAQFAQFHFFFFKAVLIDINVWFFFNLLRIKEKKLV